MGYTKAHDVSEVFYTSDEHEQSLLGKKDIVKTIEPYLRQFGWEKSCEEYFDNLFEFESKFFDKEMLVLIRGLKESGVECLLCTDKNKIRYDFILNSLKGIFDDGFASYDIGFLKRQEGFWKYVVTNLKERCPNINLKEIAFFDDKQENVDVSLKFGLSSFLFTNIEQFKKDLSI
ncbi:MAG: hypothetical protein PHU32_06270 [Candidatus ainarchaeum sp.]|nr:hypothetical protein [Candidatus ainarchaeum sp.]